MVCAAFFGRSLFVTLQSSDHLNRSVAFILSLSFFLGVATVLIANYDRLKQSSGVWYPWPSFAIIHPLFNMVEEDNCEVCGFP